MNEVRMPSSRLPWAALLLALAGLAALYWDAISTPFLNDDFLFLEEAGRRSLADALGDLGPLGNYYRPLSRQIYFAALAPLAHGHPLLFHLVNAALFVIALLLLGDLLRAFLPRAGVLAGLLYFAVLPFQRVNLMWVSCSQDLLALVGTLGALALYRRGRIVPALLCFAIGFTSKETALALPLALVAWDRVVAGRRWSEAVRGAFPFAALAIAWAAVGLAMRARQPDVPPLDLAPAAFVAGLLHLVQSVLGLEHPAGIAAALAANGPPLVPLVLLGSLALWYAPERRTAAARPQRGAAPGTAPDAAADAPPDMRPDKRKVIVFAVLWMVAFALPAGPVSYSWSSYYYTLSAAGAALIVGMLFAHGDRWTWLALSAGLLWWHAAASRSPAFAVAERRWVWTSHLTPFYFQRAAALTDSLSRQLRKIEPRPAPHTRFFFATLPPWAGFQMGNGAQIRALYRDTTLASYFYSQFSDSTADDLPARFLFWDGRALIPLYANARDPWFQVGSDLLLLDRPEGARHAFVRGLAAGGDRMDLLYWLGWAELMRGRRDRAEAAWTAFGAKDDSLVWSAHLRAARNALTDGDTVNARRHLITAIEYGMGRPEAHAVLGDLLLADPRNQNHKYGLMELEVARWLNPRDWVARRSLALGLARVRLEEQARRELASLLEDFPRVASDTAVASAWKRYRGDRKSDVVEMKGGR